MAITFRVREEVFMIIILYVMDCLRPDFLDCYGFRLNASPNLDRLVQDGALYENAYANSSWSFPSMVSMLTSQYPRTLETMHELSSIPDYVRSLPQILDATGFDTVAVTASSWFSPDFGVRGFQRFEGVYDHTNLIEQRGRHPATPARRDKEFSTVMAHSEDLNELAFEIIDQTAGRDVFMMIWSLDTHPPYYVRGERSRFGNSTEDYYREGQVSLDRLRRLYCDMVFYNDQTFGMLINKLKEAGLYDQSMVLVLGDHGVSFGEHNVLGHGGIVYEEQIRVPLIIKYPKNAHAGFRQRLPVQLADLLPTVLDVCGISYEGEFIEGESVVPGRPLDMDRVIFAETHARPSSTYSAALIKGRYKFIKVKPPPLPGSASITRKVKSYIRKLSKREREFTCDLTTSDGENAPLIRKRVHGEMAKQYQAVLLYCDRRRAELQETAPDYERSDAGSEVDPEVLKRLRSLGYL
jgi:arylsulfatase A-like enzyme